MNGSTRITDNPFTLSAETTLSVVIFSYATNSNVVITPMLCTEEAYAQSTAYQPPALPNYDLTRLEAEDRAGLIDVVDGGAKNLAEIPTTQTIGSITFTKDSNEWITSNSSTPDGRQWRDANKNVVYSVKAGRYIIYGETASTNTGTVDAYVIVNGNLYQPLIITANSNGTVEVNLTSAGTIGLMYKPYSTNKVRYMICTKAAFGVSQKFVPYRPNYQDLINATAIEVLTSSDIFTPNTNYTVINDGAIYKQGKHIFGNLIVSKSDGNFNTVETTIGQIKTGYRPVKLYIGNGTTCNTSQWGVNGIGYCYIPASIASTPNVIVKTSTDDANKFSVVIIPLDYCTP